MPKSKYYVVWQGIKPGIYRSWADAEAQVKGHKGARFKSFATMQEAESAYSNDIPSKANKASTAAPKTAPGPTNLSSTDLSIFCDGACDPNPGAAGTGLAIYRAGVLDELRYGLYRAKGTNNTAELQGLYHALLLAEGPAREGLSIEIHCDSMYAINALSTWGYGWKAKGWKRKSGEVANRDIVEPAHELFDSIKDGLTLLHVQGHSGVEGNELADRMAMHAISENEVELLPYPGPLDIAEVLKMRAG